MRLPESLLAQVDAEAERLGQTRTKYVERALGVALESALIPSTVADLKALERETNRTMRPLPPGVKSARELAMERQRKMNERKS